MPKVLLPTPADSDNDIIIIDEETLRDIALKSMGIKSDSRDDYEEVEMEISDNDSDIQMDPHECIYVDEINSEGELITNSSEGKSSPASNKESEISEHFELLLRERALKSLCALSAKEKIPTKEVYTDNQTLNSYIILGKNKPDKQRFLINLNDDTDNEEATPSPQKNITPIKKQSKIPNDFIKEKLLTNIKELDKKLIDKRKKIEYFKTLIRNHSAEYAKKSSEVLTKVQLINKLQNELKMARSSLLQSKKSCRLHKNYIQNYTKQVSSLKAFVTTSSSQLNDLTKRYEIHRKTIASVPKLDIDSLKEYSLNFLKGSCCQDESVGIISTIFPKTTHQLKYHEIIFKNIQMKSCFTDTLIDSQIPICPYAIDGVCLDKSCTFQHPSFLQPISERLLEARPSEHKISNESRSSFCHICKTNFNTSSDKISNKLKIWHSIYERFFFNFSSSPTQLIDAITICEAKDSVILSKHVIFSLGLSASKSRDKDPRIFQIIKNNNFHPDLCSFSLQNYSLNETQKMSLYADMKKELLAIIGSSYKPVSYCHCLFILIISYFRNVRKNSQEYQWLMDYIMSEESSSLIGIYIRFAFIVITLDFYEFVDSSEIPFLSNYQLSQVQKIFLQMENDCVENCIQIINNSDPSDSTMAYVPVSFALLYCQYLHYTDQANISIDICNRLLLGKINSSYIDKVSLYLAQFIQDNKTNSAQTPTRKMRTTVYLALTHWSKGDESGCISIIERLVKIIQPDCKDYLTSIKVTLGISKTSIFSPTTEYSNVLREDLIYIWLTYFLYLQIKSPLDLPKAIQDFISYGGYLIRTANDVISRIIFTFLMKTLNLKVAADLTLSRMVMQFFLIENFEFLNRLSQSTIAQIELFTRIDWPSIVVSGDEELVVNIVEIYGISPLKIIIPIYFENCEYLKLMRLFQLVRLEYPESEWFWSSLVCVSMLSSKTLDNLHTVIEVCKEAIMLRPHCKDIWKQLAYLTSIHSKDFKACVYKEALLFSDETARLIRGIYNKPSLFFTDLDETIYEDGATDTH